jgi:hypothetical protein
VEDTDWFLDRLYSFAGDQGATLLVPKYSRYLVDLNRASDNAPMYPGQNNTELCPTRHFSGDPIYQPGQAPDETEVQRRVATYWQPYHQALQAQLVGRAAPVDGAQPAEARQPVQRRDHRTMVRAGRVAVVRRAQAAKALISLVLKIIRAGIAAHVEQALRLLLSEGAEIVRRCRGSALRGVLCRLLRALAHRHAAFVTASRAGSCTK